MKPFHIQTSQNHMATTFHFTVSCEQGRIPVAKTVLEEAQALVGRLELELTEFDSRSPIHQLNSARAGERVRLSPSALRLLSQSEEIRETTDDAFRVTAKSKSGGATVHFSSEEG